MHLVPEQADTSDMIIKRFNVNLVKIHQQISRIVYSENVGSTDVANVAYSENFRLTESWSTTVQYRYEINNTKVAIIILNNY